MDGEENMEDMVLRSYYNHNNIDDFYNNAYIFSF